MVGILNRISTMVGILNRISTNEWLYTLPELLSRWKGASLKDIEEQYSRGRLHSYKIENRIKRFDNKITYDLRNVFMTFYDNQEATIQQNADIVFLDSEVSEIEKHHPEYTGIKKQDIPNLVTRKMDALADDHDEQQKQIAKLDAENAMLRDELARRTKTAEQDDIGSDTDGLQAKLEQYEKDNTVINAEQWRACITAALKLNAEIITERETGIKKADYLKRLHNQTEKGLTLAIIDRIAWQQLPAQHKHGRGAPKKNTQ